MEKTNGRVRGFFGIIEKVNDVAQAVPYSLDFYIKLYEKYIAPKWNSFTFHYNENIELDMPIDVSDSVIKPLAGSSLNNDLNICRVFLSPRLSQKWLSEALAYKGNMSIAIGISNNEQVTEDNFPLMNATLKNEECRSYEDVAVCHTCSNCGRKAKQIHSNGLCTDCSEKQIAVSHKKKEDSTILEIPKHHCNRCGKRVAEVYTEEELCSDCYNAYVVGRKKKRRNVGIIICLILVGFLTYLFTPKSVFNALNSIENQIDTSKSCIFQTSVDVYSKDSLEKDTLKKYYKK